MSNARLLSFGDSPRERNASKWLFLIGLGSATQIYIGGYTAISELFLVLFLPIALFQNIGIFVKDRCTTILWLLLFWSLGQLVTDLYVHNSFSSMIRGQIPPVGIFAALIVIYPLLKRNPGALKFLLLGMAISGVVCIFVFQPGTTVGSYSVQTGVKTAVEARIGYKLFWVNQMESWLGLPVKGWYMSMPQMGNFLIALFLSIFSLATGGRSAFLIGFFSSVLLFIGGKSHQKMLRISRHFVALIVGIMALLVVAKFVYKEAALHGLMGDEEKKKYFEQSEGKGSLETLMSGRSEFFVALLAIKDHPVIGHGSCAMDYEGYWPKFVSLYGSTEDYQRIAAAYAAMDRTIPAHSHIMQFWMWAGIPGLLPWLYILWLITFTLFKRMHVYPPYYGFLAMIIPYLYWHIFFSPFGGRIAMGMNIAACLFIRWFERGARQIPNGL